MKTWNLVGISLFFLIHLSNANAGDPGLIESTLRGAHPIVELRLRSESVEQRGLTQEANAITLRGRFGFETGKVWNTSLLAEAEMLWPIQSDYNSTVNGKTAYPVIADSENYEVNRLQLTNASIPNTVLTLGRQRINLDDQRFVGNVGWRQNEQTFDAVRIANTPIKDLAIDVSYLNQVNRVFGKESPQGRYKGNMLLANLTWQTHFGKITGFGYLVGFDSAAAAPAAATDSSTTYGLRYGGQKSLQAIEFGYVASYAHQKERGANPIKFHSDYLLAEFTSGYRGFTMGAGWEILGGDGIKGFTTPLATLHKFQGWADKFSTTPPNGIDDRYVSAGFLTKSPGPMDSLSITASYHSYRSERFSLRFGSEIDVQAQIKWNRLTGTLKYADYSAKTFATDTRKLWLQLEFIL